MNKRHCRGFTLLEVLVVVAIGAIVAGMVILRLGDWRSPHAPERQLERLAALIEAQCEQALFQSRPRGVRFTDEGYDFWQAAAEGWVLLPDEGINRSRQWLGGVEPELDVTGHRARLGEAPEAPHLVCEPLGELSPFTLELRVDGQNVRLAGDSAGNMKLEARHR